MDMQWTEEVDIALFVMAMGLFIFILGLTGLFLEKRSQANEKAYKAELHQRMCAEWIGPLPKSCQDEHP
jgi:hypothetical protein